MSAFAHPTAHDALPQDDGLAGEGRAAHKISECDKLVLTGKPGASEEENHLVRMTAGFETVRDFVELIEERGSGQRRTSPTFLLNSQFQGQPIDNEKMITSCSS